MSLKRNASTQIEERTLPHISQWERRESNSQTSSFRNPAFDAGGSPLAYAPKPAVLPLTPPELLKRQGGDRTRIFGSVGGESRTRTPLRGPGSKPDVAAVTPHRRYACRSLNHAYHSPSTMRGIFLWVSSVRVELTLSAHSTQCLCQLDYEDLRPVSFDPTKFLRSSRRWRL